jgi:hypothetical protein
MQGGDLSLQDRRVVGQVGEEAVDQPTLVGQAAEIRFCQRSVGSYDVIHRIGMISLPCFFGLPKS